tara:strand:- start:590 stop:862 length:273 start_codon:yes stop_codon:yes gene_type:complete
MQEQKVIFQNTISTDSVTAYLAGALRITIQVDTMATAGDLKLVFADASEYKFPAGTYGFSLDAEAGSYFQAFNLDSGSAVPTFFQLAVYY